MKVVFSSMVRKVVVISLKQTLVLVRLPLPPSTGSSSWTGSAWWSSPSTSKSNWSTVLGSKLLHKSETFHTQVVLGRAASSGSGEQANYLLPGR